MIQPQQLAELAAFQVILAKVQVGSVTRKGRPVSASEYNTWVKANLSSGVKELLDTIFGPGILTAVDPVVAPKTTETVARK